MSQQDLFYFRVFFHNKVEEKEVDFTLNESLQLREFPCEFPLRKGDYLLKVGFAFKDHSQISN